MTIVNSHNTSDAARHRVDGALVLDGVVAGYRGTTVLRNVTLAVPKSSIVALLGPNGAGKTTLLRTASGLLPTMTGSIHLNGRDVTNSRPHQRSGRGLCLIPEGRGVFSNLTVKENLRMFQPPRSVDGEEGMARALEAFPDVANRLNQVAGTMSGGQQQMLALCRAWIAQADVVLLDEVSMGLAPKIVDEIFVGLRSLAQTGVSLLIVEQYVRHALAIADHVYLLDKGEVHFSGAADALDEDALTSGYFGDH